MLRKYAMFHVTNGKGILAHQSMSYLDHICKSFEGSKHYWLDDLKPTRNLEA